MPFPIQVIISWSLFKTKDFTKIKSGLLSLWFPFSSGFYLGVPISLSPSNTLGDRNSLKSHLLRKTVKWMMKLYNQSKIHALWTHYSHTSESIHKILSSFYRFSNQVVQKVISETIVDVANGYIKTNKNVIQIFTFKK